MVLSQYTNFRFAFVSTKNPSEIMDVEKLVTGIGYEEKRIVF